MPLRKADLRIVVVKSQVSPGVAAVDEGPLFAPDGQSVKAVIQPLSGDVERTVYGERATRMLVMLTESDFAFREGMGVCVEGEGGACDYRVAGPPERWRGHQRLTLERL